MPWRVFYSDREFTSADGDWSSAPIEDVQAVVIYDGPGYRLVLDGLDEYRLPGRSEVKRGRWMDTAGFYALQRRALDSKEP